MARSIASNLPRFQSRPRPVSSLGRGAFVIRGQRTWYKDMDVRIGIGIIAVNGVPMVVSGTPDPFWPFVRATPFSPRG